MLHGGELSEWFYSATGVRQACSPPMANVDNDVTPSFRVTLSCILIVSLWLVVVLCPPINVLKLPTLTSVYLCE